MRPVVVLLGAVAGQLAAGHFVPDLPSSPEEALPSLRKRAECGPGIGRCPAGRCCSGAGWCGTTADFCDGSSCQLDYSDSCDTFFPPPGPSTESIPRPHIGSVPYGSMITTCTQPGKLALTYDDGPYIYTTQLLDILDAEGVKATFFVTGNNRGKKRIDDATTAWPAILRRMYAAGHHIASHSWTHRNLNQVNSTIQRTELIYNEMAFRNLFGWVPTYWRPPYLECSAGTGCLTLTSSLGYHVINMNIDTKDFENNTPGTIQISKDRFSNAVSTNAAANRYIELSHDVHYQTVVNLTAHMISVARTRGYQLVTVGECLGDPPANWYRSVAGASTSVPPPTTSTRASTSTSSIRSSTSSTRTTSSTAAPSSTLVISPDQRCGGTTGYTCLGSTFGTCCSYYGYCGNSQSYCGTGCQSGFGSCTPPQSGISDTTNGLCGSAFAASCRNYADKTCCSQYGFCGNTPAHCGTGCQAAYGTCS